MNHRFRGGRSRPDFICAPPELVLRRQLDPLAQRLVGEEVEALSPAVVRDLFHGRILPVENHLYRLRVVSLVLGPRTLIQLQVTPAAPAAPSP